MCYSVKKGYKSIRLPRRDRETVTQFRETRGFLAVSGEENRGPIPTRSAIQNEGNEDGTIDLLDTNEDRRAKRQLKR